ncbi:MAG: glycosyltransferase family 4 protein [Candidatus Competibacteraceae bacterium]|nr:glycosyltransferase family 4 protein [Candidatus Competibacteraceae bacterium]
MPTFAPAPMPEGPITFLMIARLLRDKGVYEYVEAARMVKRAHPEARFVLVGPFDPNPTAVKPAEVEAWVREGVIDYKGAVDDVRPHIAACHVFVLPSYREGTPRTVLEAMAMGRPIITTDVPGCRETVEPSTNGIRVPLKDNDELAAALSRLANNAALRHQLSLGARRLVEQRFEARVIARATTALLHPIPDRAIAA